MGVLTADGGGKVTKPNTSIVKTLINKLSPAGYSTTGQTGATLNKPATKVTLVTPAQGPYIPGVSNNPAAINSAAGNVATNKTFIPVTPVKQPEGPYIPGVSNNPAAAGTASGSNVTTNRTFMPTPAADGSPGMARADGSVQAMNTNRVIRKDDGTIVPTTPAGGGGSGRPELMSGQELAKLLGTVYDRGEIEKYMTNAVAKQYANLDTEYGRTQDSYYDAVAGNANMLLDTLKRGDRQAAMSGASAGSQAATSLSALLGVGQQNAQGATELAQGRSDLVTKREADIAAAKNTALKTYNDLSTTLGERISSVHNANMVGYTGELGADASKTAAQIAAESSKYAADKALEGTGLTANASVLAASKYGGSSGYTTPTDPNAAVNQQIANLMARLSDTGLTSAQRAAINAELDSLMGIKAAPKKEDNTTLIINPGNSTNKNKNWINPESTRPDR